ncbi:Uncharacterised protein [uncultured archaeon]|nr:Uncharacterised protein [uncultured archaeon]
MKRLIPILLSALLVFGCLYTPPGPEAGSKFSEYMDSLVFDELLPGVEKVGNTITYSDNKSELFSMRGNCSRLNSGRSEFDAARDYCDQASITRGSGITG